MAGAVTDLFAASADKSNTQGLRIEGQEYTLASQLAQQNAQYTVQSTALQEFQKSRERADDRRAAGRRSGVRVCGIRVCA
jgi:hypothetical protein